MSKKDHWLNAIDTREPTEMPSGSPSLVIALLSLVTVACQVLDRYRRSTIHFKRRKAESCSVSRSACEEANGQMRSYLSKFLVTQALMHQATCFLWNRIPNFGFDHFQTDHVPPRHSFGAPKCHFFLDRPKFEMLWVPYQPICLIETT